MENMDKELTVPKWVLIVQPKLPPNAPEFVCPICLPKPKSLRFSKLEGRKYDPLDFIIWIQGT